MTSLPALLGALVAIIQAHFLSKRVEVVETKDESKTLKRMSSV